MNRTTPDTAAPDEFATPAPTHTDLTHARDECAKLIRALPILRFNIRATTDQPLRLASSPGHALRGAFGAVLRRSVCVTHLPQCSGCALHETCAYTQLYEPTVPNGLPLTRHISDGARPYVVHSPARLGPRHPVESPEPFTFGFSLIGPAVRHADLVAAVWHRLFQRGFGRPAKAQLQSIERENVVIDLDDQHVRSVALHFTTPLRLQHNGKTLQPHELTPRKLISALLRRLSMLSAMHGARLSTETAATLAAHADQLTGTTDMQRVRINRRSKRQGQIIPLDGALGTWTLEGNLTPVLPLLRLGEAIHVGKTATHGHGAYRLVTRT